MAALCGPNCGFCGACTAAWEREADDRERCETCGEDLTADAVLLTTGSFCSARCADVAGNLQQAIRPTSGATIQALADKTTAEGLKWFRGRRL